MKKVNFLEIFLFMLCIICFIVGMLNFYSIFSNVATLLFPDTDVYGDFNNLVYIKRSLFSNVPMLIASVSIFFFSFKKALFEHNKKDTI